MLLEALVVIVGCIAVLAGSLACGFIGMVILASLCKAVFPNNRIIFMAGIFSGVVAGACAWLYVVRGDMP